MNKFRAMANLEALEGNEENAGGVSQKIWDSMSPGDRAEYIKKYPKSKYNKSGGAKSDNDTNKTTPTPKKDAEWDADDERILSLRKELRDVQKKLKSPHMAPRSPAEKKLRSRLAAIREELKSLGERHD